MYDTVTLWKQSSSSQLKELQELSDSIEKKSSRTGEVYHKGRFRNFDCMINQSGLLLRGSLPRYYFGDNIHLLSRKETGQAIEKLSDELGLNFEQAKVFRLDIGLNMVMNYPCSSYYGFIGDSRYYKKAIYGNESIVFTSKIRSKLLYDKIKEYNYKSLPVPSIFEGKNILRYELRFTKRLKNQFHLKESLRAGQLSDESFYMAAIDRLKEEYHNIEKIQRLSPMQAELPKKPKDFDEYFAALGIQFLGLSGALELLNQSRPYLDKQQYYRARNRIKRLASNRKFTDEPEQIRELTSKINQGLKFYR